MKHSYKWENIGEESDTSITERMKVPGGWLIKCTETEQENNTVALTFYPDPARLWS